jgi:hypothetical protein
VEWPLHNEIAAIFAFSIGCAIAGTRLLREGRAGWGWVFFVVAACSFLGVAMLMKATGYAP